MTMMLALLAFPAATLAAKPFTHGWDTPADMMAMHGKYKTVPLDKDIDFIAAHYGGMITTGTGCPSQPSPDTIEQSVLAVAARIKAVKPTATIGMYWRTDFALVRYRLSRLSRRPPPPPPRQQRHRRPPSAAANRPVSQEVAQCSGFASEWKAHPEYRLKDDRGNVVGKPNHYYYDWLNPAASQFFANVLLNVTRAVLPTSGKPTLDYVYCDGAGAWNSANPRPFAAGVGLARSHKLMEAKHAMFAEVQRQLDARGNGQSLILNGMDLRDTAVQFVATGAAGAMFDHWTILQFLDRQTGAFNATMVDEGFSLVTSPLLSNFTTQVKVNIIDRCPFTPTYLCPPLPYVVVVACQGGACPSLMCGRCGAGSQGWVGPVVKQRGHYPPNFAQVNTTTAMVSEASERFNSELAMFLLVATEHDFWIYSWFWGFYDYVGGNEASTVPPDFFPQAKCKLGAPAGPMQRLAGTWTYRRQFAHASVFVDLTNRTASKVDFVGCPYPTPPLPPPPRAAPAPGPPGPPPPPKHYPNCPSVSGHGCAACVSTVDGRCPGTWCNQPCVHLSEKLGARGGNDCQPANWWEKQGKQHRGVSCTGNATGCRPACAR
jgi:hypothetical protein